MLIIGIGGGTGSGKTTVVRKIIESLPDDSVAVIPQDSYYNDQSNLPLEVRKRTNFDHPDAFEWPLFARQIKDLKEGKAIEQPTYSYITCTRLSETIHVEPKDVIIIEGIMALYDKKLRDLMDLKIFVDAGPDERLLRVIARDTVERGHPLEMLVDKYRNILKPMHDEFIEPTKQFADIIRKNEPNFIVGVPTLFEALVNTKLKSYDLESVTAVICGGDALTQTLRDKVNHYLENHGSDAKIRVGYGLTEGSGAVCLSPENAFSDNIIGAPFPDTDFKIVKNGTFKALPVGEEGEICISGPLVMMGYLDDDVETAQTLRLHEDGKLWLHTGDLGYLGEDGLVYFAQRLKRIIISSGYNIYPTHLESIINSHEAVLTSTVIGID